jgi:phage gpG-like protein
MEFTFDLKMDKINTNINPMPKSILDNLMSHIYDHFRKEVNPEGSWSSLKYRTGKMLYVTGTLMSGWDGEITNDTVTISNSVEYASFHEMGTSSMPKRSVAWIDSAIADEILELFADHLMEQL